jgi:Natural resistance-associated macrophage protein
LSFHLFSIHMDGYRLVMGCGQRQIGNGAVTGLTVHRACVSARLGRVRGHGLATNIGRHCPAWLHYGSVVLLLVANTINIAAHLTAMGAAVNLVIVIVDVLPSRSMNRASTCPRFVVLGHDHAIEQSSDSAGKRGYGDRVVERVIQPVRKGQYRRDA